MPQAHSLSPGDRAAAAVAVAHSGGTFMLRVLHR
jgi:hypothetical protein